MLYGTTNMKEIGFEKLHNKASEQAALNFLHLKWIPLHQKELHLLSCLYFI